MGETHLPECRVRTYTTDDGMVYEVAGDLCICPALRACEARVRQDMALQYLVTDREQQEAEQRAYAAGVQAARDAVAALPNQYAMEPGHVALALAAIDALRDDA